MPAKKYKPVRQVRGDNPRLLDDAPFDIGRSLPFALWRAAHLRHGVLVTLALAVGAALAGRSGREIALVAVTVLVGQVLLGWHNDLVDAKRDRLHGRANKPVAEGYLDRSTLTFAIACGVLLVIPLSVANGLAAGIAHLAILTIAMLTNVGVLRRTRFSFVPWALTFGAFPTFLSWGGWGREDAGDPATVAITITAGLIGIGVHLIRSLPGLVDDNKDGSSSLPLTIALKTGAPKLMLISIVWLVMSGALLIVAALTSGLAR